MTPRSCGWPLGAEGGLQLAANTRPGHWSSHHKERSSADSPRALGSGLLLHQASGGNAAQHIVVAALRGPEQVAQLRGRIRGPDS